MYCSSCGSAVNAGLTYCNHCGAGLNSGRAPASAAPDTLVWATVAVTVVGLGGLIGLMAVMKNELHFNEGLIIFFSLVFLLTVLVVDSVFVWQMLRPRKESRDLVVRARAVTNPELNAASPQALQEPPISVTDHTTRSFEHPERAEIRE